MKKPRKFPTSIGFAVLAAQVAAGSKEVQLLPAGDFRSADGSGRPDDIEGGKPWHTDAAVAALVIARAGVQNNWFVIDYEHQTLNTAQNGQPAPAAGRWKTMEWREGVGLFAVDVQWTDRAAQHIAAKEYLYISAVFFYDRQTGNVLAMRMAALTNTPGLDGMQPLAALTAQMGADWTDPCCGPQTNETDESTDEKGTLMDLLKKLLAALGLPDSTPAEAALTAVTALKTKSDTDSQALAALKAQGPASGQVDLTQYVPIAAYNATVAQMAALTAQGENADTLISAAEKEGKVLPAEKDWLTQMGKTNGVAALKAHLAVRPVIPALVGMQSTAALTQQIAGAGSGGAATQITAEGLAVCSQLGLTTEQWLKANGKT